MGQSPKPRVAHRGFQRKQWDVLGIKNSGERMQLSGTDRGKEEA